MFAGGTAGGGAAAAAAGKAVFGKAAQQQQPGGGFGTGGASRMVHESCVWSPSYACNTIAAGHALVCRSAVVVYASKKRVDT
jgi:hypothetical protein